VRSHQQFIYMYVLIHRPSPIKFSRVAVAAIPHAVSALRACRITSFL
jgi:hypothetical protein